MKNHALSPFLLSQSHCSKSIGKPNSEKFGPTYRSDLDLVFCNPDGTPFHPDSFSAAISNLFRWLKIVKPKGAALHLLRHTHGSEMLAAGVDIVTVAARLGHSSPSTTANVYAHALQGRDVEAVKRLELFQKAVLDKGKETEKPQ